MNKILFIFLFLFSCPILSAQDSLAKTEPPKVAAIKFTEKDIRIDSETVEKKAFNKNFKKKYTDSEFVYEYKVPEKNLWDRFKEWLASIFRDLFSFESTATSIKFVGILLRIIAVLVIVVVIYLITMAIIGKEGQWIFGKNANKKTIYYSDFEKLIRESILSGEKRVAIRYYYLWLLKIMAQNNYIEWDIEKTNSDYLYELQNPAHKEQFTYLSYLYNYIWYGEFEIDENSFTKAENRFKNALKTFGNG